MERKTRILSVLAYLGLAPFLYISGVSHQQNKILKHHTEYSLAFAFTVLTACVYYVIAMTMNFWVVTDVWHPTLDEFNASAREFGIYVMTDTIVSLSVILIWGLILLTSFLSALYGKVIKIQIIQWMIKKSWIMRVGAIWSLVIEVILIFFLGLAIHTLKTTQQSQPSDAKIYILYTIGGYIPLPGLYESFTPSPWMAALAFYPTVQAGIERFGENSVALLPLTEENFTQATQTGKFIFIASHGGMTSGSFTLSVTPHIQYSPNDVNAEYVGEDLQFVYFSGCYTGDREADWKRVLKVENAVLFDRISYVDEHMLWAWFKSPTIIKNLQ